MIKKTILMLLVLVGGVVSANADSRIYVKLTNNWWTNDNARFYINGTNTELTLTNAYGGWYTCTTNASKVKIDRRNETNSTTWNTSSEFSVSGDTFVEIDGNSNATVLTQANQPWTAVYLNDDANSWGNGSISQPFTKTDRNHFYYDLDAHKIRNGNYQFRFYVADGGGHMQPANDNDVITSNDYSNCESGSTFSFRINQNSNAKSVRINLSYSADNNNNWKWHLTATITEYSGTTTIYYVNENGMTSLGETVYAHVWDPSNNNFQITGTGWPGTEMTRNADGTFTLSGVSYEEGIKVIFNNNDGTQTDDAGFALAENSFYNYSGQVTTVPVSITNDYGTFASQYPLTFPENGAIYAYKASQIVGNKMIMERVIGTVPAKTGLFLEKITDNSMTVSPCATTTVDASGNYLKAGGVSVTSDATGDRYGFQTKTTGVGFYKITGDAVAVPENKAYLELPAGTVTAPSLSIEIDGETTGIKVINWEDVDANNDGQIYDLQGRRVYQPTTGIYIKNGKKVIVK